MRITFNHLMQKVICKTTLIAAYSRLSDRKVVSIHRLPAAIQGCTFTPLCVDKERRTVRLVSRSYDHLVHAIQSNAIINI